ncbi:GtrA family protein [Patescibacteria group bacterium]|nr:GtrA family protein [Patescibacteria group bacterium]
MAENQSLFIKYKPLIFQFLRFVVVGIINTSIDYIIYLCLTRFIDWFDENKVVATSIAFVVAATNSYFMNKFFTFRDKSKEYGTQYIKFFFVSLVGFGINAFIFYLLLETGMFDILAKVLTTGVVLVWNFFANKFWTFKQKIPRLGKPEKK